MSLALGCAAALLVAGCSDGEGEGTAITIIEPASSTVTTTTGVDATLPAASRLEAGDEIAVSAAYRQGVARVDDGWIFTTNKALYRTDEALVRVVSREDAIPADLLAAGFVHLGDGDVDDGVLIVPLEQPDYALRSQRMVRFDATTLEPLGSVEVAQEHAAWVSVADGVALTMSGFSDDVVLRYDAGSWESLEPLVLGERVERVQGGDVLDGVLWLTTDDEVDGVYAVDLATGRVERAGSLGHVDGEGEGVDATALPSGDLHALTVDHDQSPVWFQHLRVLAG